MKFYKSWFWMTLIVFIALGIFTFAYSGFTDAKGLLTGIAAGLAMGWFLWMIFGKIPNIRIPENVSSGFKIPVTLVGNDKIWDKMMPKLIIFEDHLEYFIFREKSIINYSNIQLTEIKRGFHQGATDIGRSSYAMNVILHLKNKEFATFNLHRPGNLLELLKFFKKKKIKLDKNSENWMQENSEV